LPCSVYYRDCITGGNNSFSLFSRLKKIVNFGFEREFFLSNGKTFVFLPKDTKIPHDNCGYLAEARGNPSNSPWYASRLYYSAVDQLDWLCHTNGLKLVNINETVFDPLFVQEIKSKWGIKRNSTAKFLIGGKKYEYRNRAGFHVHFETKGFFTRKLRINIIKQMDAAFAKEISESQRISGEYEFKPYGFEYRCLPANINVNKLVNVLEKLQTNLNS